MRDPQLWAHTIRPCQFRVASIWTTRAHGRPTTIGTHHTSTSVQSCQITLRTGGSTWRTHKCEHTLCIHSSEIAYTTKVHGRPTTVGMHHIQSASNLIYNV